MNPSPAFVTPAPFSARPRVNRAALARSPHHPCFLHHHFRIFRPHIHPHTYVARQPIAVQARPVSGDSDGEVRDQVDPSVPKSFAVGVTIVSDCDARLRRPVTERIVAEARVGRIVVVTTAGITATDETDGLAEPPVFDSVDQDPAPDPAVELPPSSQIADQPEDEPLNGVNSLESPPASAVDNLGGWISCSSPEEMVEVVLKLSASRECDYIVAECAADDSIEPQELARILDVRGGSTLRVDALVSVLDGDTLLQDLSALPAPSDLPVQSEDVDVADDAGNVAGNDTPVEAPAPEQQPIREDGPQRAMMVVKLVENANVIVVRQSSAEQPDQLSRVQSVVSVLNGSASIVPATDEAVPVNLLVNTNTYDNETLKLGATWKRVLLASRAAEPGTTKPLALPKSLKEATFLYQARRPFHPQRLYQQIKAVATFTGVIRSTGRFWLATRMEAPLEWNQAGVAATLRTGKPFWAAIPEPEWTLSEEERIKVMSNWDTQHGDRETEIVFVGIDIDKTRLQGLLDGCLLNDEEIVFPNMWENFEDPFVEWVPLIEDEEEVEDVANEAINQGAEIVAPTQDVTEEQYTISETGDTVTVSDPTLEGEMDTDSIAEKSDSEKDFSSGLSKKSMEGEVSADDLPEDMMKNISALEFFEAGFPEGDGSSPQPLPSDEGEFDEDDAVLASWDGSVADGILTQIPKMGLPVTIVTGFLGSGKTTLLNHILTADHGLKVAVLVNEFGEIDIDSQLVEKGDWSDSDDVMELINGCICCSINDSFVSTVEKIVERHEDVDYLIVETTGVADPVPVINSLMGSKLAERVRIDGILTVVDSENFDVDTHMGSEAALSQVMAADTILLSKTDIASKEKVDQTMEYIRSVRPAARILKSQRGRVPLNMILDVGIRVTDSPAHLHPVKTKQEKADDHDGYDHDHDHDHENKSEAKHAHDHDDEHEHGSGCSHGSHDHDHDHEHGPDCSHGHESHDHSNHLEADGFVTTSFKSDVPLDAELFMSLFLQRLPEGVFRAKGLLCFYGYSKRYVFQLSGRRYQFEEDEWPDGVAPGNQLVVIGRDLDLESLGETLESCQVKSEA